MKGISSPPSKLKVKVGSFTRDTTLASGTQAITGIGFKPKAVIFIGGENATDEAFVGLDDGATALSVGTNDGVATGRWDQAGSSSISDLQGSGVNYKGYVSSLDSDGFTKTWTKAGSPTGILTTFFLAMG